MNPLASAGIRETPHRDPTLTDIDLKKTLLQHLESLQWSGLSDLSTGGDLEFNLAKLEETLSTPSAQADLAPSTASSLLAQSKTRDAAPSVSQAEAGVAESEEARTPKVIQPVLLADGNYGEAIADVAQREAELAVIADEVSGCVKCAELCRNRINTVFGTGPANARIVFLGEGPGATEDEKGAPFVGAAGQLLDKIFAASKLDRSQVYILNVVKCRPPGNRNPADSEIQNCWNYFERQLEIIQPTHIVCLGSVAAKSLLNTKMSLGKMRKQFHAYRGSKVIVTYHPAYLLRTPSAKKHVWEDMKLLMSEFGVEL